MAGCHTQPVELITARRWRRTQKSKGFLAKRTHDHPLIPSTRLPTVPRDLPVDRLVSDASADDYDALLLPGGTMNPDQLGVNKDAVGFVKAS
ncbi:DJ-1/PfpI family protein [Streptomyces europaeiscabiei]|uniref:DJ-1/PfpI family protein n=1 Tax=Streptomyces europaeiscabiei TaxID=146819 RepID=UPI0029CA80B4|nr:DJ-1/PfpI family protein [Streptomyces europaeiscabiei]